MAFHLHTKGATHIEYAILLGIITMSSLALISNLGTITNNTFENITSKASNLIDQGSQTSDQDNTPSPLLHTPSTTIPEEEVSLMETDMIFESCDDAFNQGYQYPGYFRLLVGNLEYTNYCYMARGYAEGNPLRGGWSLVALQHEETSVPWVSGSLPEVNAKGYPTLSNTLSISQIPQHTKVAFGAARIKSAPEPKLTFAVDITMSEIFQFASADGIVLLNQSSAGYSWTSDAIAYLPLARAQTCEFTQTINLQGFDLYPYQTLSYKQAYNSWNERYGNPELTDWQFSPNAPTNAEKGACLLDGSGNSYLETDDTAMSWNIFVK